MAKSADGPPIGGMGFGYKASVRRRVPYVATMTVHEENLIKFARRRPEHAERVARMLNDKRPAGAILYELREEGLDGVYAIGFARDPEADSWIDTRYSDDQASVEEVAEYNICQGVYACAILWGFDKEAGEWREIRTWPAA